jgi:hypothetical protein
MISIGMLGGMIIANMAEEVIRPTENCLGYFFFCRAGIIKLEMDAMAARSEPEMAPKNP